MPAGLPRVRCPSEMQLTGGVGLPQGRQVLAAEDRAQHQHGQEPVGPTGHPAWCLGGRLGGRRPRGWGGHRQPAPRDHTVNVGMMFQLLTPGVQHHQHPDLRFQMFGIGGHLQKRLLGLAKSSRYISSRLPRTSAEFVGQGEDHVEVGHGKQVGLTFGQPSRPLGATTLRTASIAARMVVVSDLTAVIALSDVSTQGVRAAECQVLKRLPHMRALGPALQEASSVLPHDLPQG